MADDAASQLRIIFAGTPAFAAVALRGLLDAGHRICAVYTQPDRPAGRGRRLTASPVKTVAVEHTIPVYQPTTLRDAEEQTRLADLNADLMIVAAYGLLLPAPVLQAPRLGCVNIHASLLPRWRGAAPIQRAILAGDEETGICIMQMDEGLDTGDVLARAACPIGPGDTAESLHDRLAALGARLLLDTLPAIANGTATAEPQDDSRATYAAKLSKQEGLLVWERSAAELDRQVRAFNPWPVAFTVLQGSQLRVWQAAPLDQASDALPGTVVACGAPGIDVATGDGVLRIEELQLAGGRRMTAAQFLAARPLLGTRFEVPDEVAAAHAAAGTQAR